MSDEGKPEYFRKLVGERCYLSPISLEDAARYCEWLNDLEVARTLTLATANISLSGEKDVLARIAKDHNYGIIEIDSNTLIGNCGLADINHVDRTCEIGIFIGDKSYWGKGYGPEAMSLLLGYGFDYLNMRNIWLQAYAFNARGLAAYKKLGFREVGRRRKAVRREGAEHDVVFMDLLDDEFRQRKNHLHNEHGVRR